MKKLLLITTLLFSFGAIAETTELTIEQTEKLENKFSTYVTCYWMASTLEHDKIADEFRGKYIDVSNELGWDFDTHMYEFNYSLGFSSGFFAAKGEVSKKKEYLKLCM